MTTIETNPTALPPVKLKSANRRRSCKTVPTVLWIAGMVILTTIVLYPLFWMISASFKPSSEFGANQGFFPENPTVDNYFKVMEGVAGIPTWHFFWNSFILGVAR